MNEPLAAAEDAPRRPWVSRLFVFLELLAFVLIYILFSGLIGAVIVGDDPDVEWTGAQLFLVQLALIALTYPLIVLFLRARNERLSSLGFRMSHSAGHMLLVGILLGLLLRIGSFPLGILAYLFGLDSQILDFDLPDTLNRLALFLGVPIAGIHEELVFRGYLRKRFAELLGDPDPEGSLWITGVVTSVLFGVLHFDQGAGGAIVVTFVGLGFYWIATTKPFTLIHAMIAHAVFNAIAAMFLLAIQ